MRSLGFSFLLLGIQRKANSINTIRKGKRLKSKRRREGGTEGKWERKCLTGASLCLSEPRVCLGELVVFLEFRWRIWSRIESENPSHPPEHAFFVTSWKVTSPESNLKDISRIAIQSRPWTSWTSESFSSTSFSPNQIIHIEDCCCCCCCCC